MQMWWERVRKSKEYVQVIYECPLIRSGSLSERVAFERPQLNSAITTSCRPASKSATGDRDRREAKAAADAIVVVVIEGGFKFTGRFVHCV